MRPGTDDFDEDDDIRQANLEDAIIDRDYDPQAAREAEMKQRRKSKGVPVVIWATPKPGSCRQACEIEWPAKMYFREKRRNKFIFEITEGYKILDRSEESLGVAGAVTSTYLKMELVDE